MTATPKSRRRKPTAPLGPNGFKYRPQYGVIVKCDGEGHQRAVYEKLRKQGYNLKVVVV